MGINRETMDGRKSGKRMKTPKVKKDGKTITDQEDS